MSITHMLLKSKGVRQALLIPAFLFAAACGSDEVDSSGDSPCPAGQFQSPVTGACLPDNGDTCQPGFSYNEALDECIKDAPMVDMSMAPKVDMNNAGEPDAGDKEPDAGDSADMGGADGGGGGGGDVDMDSMTDMSVSADMWETIKCDESLDTDNDGLDNKCECDLQLDGQNPDTDGDGLKDGEEDADGNCGIDPGETSPNIADTDSDGLNDGDEKTNMLDPLDRDSDGDGLPDGIEVNGCTDPKMADTDGDTLPDGVEDANKDGQIGICMPGMFTAMCARGESNPCAKDSDNDGRPDNEDVRYRQCTEADKMNLAQPKLIKNMTADYQIGLAPTITENAVTSVANPTLQAHVFEDVANHYTGFIASLQAPSMGMSPAQLADHVLSTVQTVPAFSGAVRRNNGRQTTTHDGFGAIVAGTIDLPPGTTSNEARDEIFKVLSATPDAAHPLMGVVAGDASPTLFRYEVIAKSATEYLIVGGFATADKVDDVTIETGWRVADLVGGSSVADAAELLEADCVTFAVTNRPEVDLIISMDNSGSMRDERMALVGFIDDLVKLLDAANLDWRIGVTGVACDGIKSDMALRQEFRDLIPAAGGGIFPTGVCQGLGGGFPFPGGGGKNNGQLEKSGNQPGFTKDVAQIKQRIDNVSTTASEYTLTMGLAAVERALPRAANNTEKIRPDAAVVVVAVTDEEDDFFNETQDFLPKPPGTPLTAAEQTALEMATTPWVDYINRPEVSASVFGLYAVPNTTCPMGAANPASQGLAIHDIVTRSGGSGGSICQADITVTLQSIANATAGISSSLRLSGAVVATSILVKQFGLLTGMETAVPRSRNQGFDYDAIVNRISFFGAMPPQTGDKLIIPYLRWKDSLVTCQKDSDCPQDGVRQRCNNAGLCEK